MTRKPLPLYRSIYLILKLKFRRFWNQKDFPFFNRKEGSRQGTSRKKGLGGMLTFLLIIPLLMSSLGLSLMIIFPTAHKVEFYQAQMAARENPSQNSLFPGEGKHPFRGEKEMDELIFDPLFVSLLNFVCFIALLFLLFSNLQIRFREISTFDTELEWLYSLPISTRGIYLTKIIEGWLLQPASWIFFSSLFSIFLLFLDYGWSILWIVPLVVLTINLLLSLGQFLCEFFLRTYLRGTNLKNLETFSVVCAMACMFLIIAFLMPPRQETAFFFNGIYYLAWIFDYTPFGILLVSLQEGTLTRQNGAIFLLSTSLTLVVTHLLLRFLSRREIEVKRGAYQGKRRRNKTPARHWLPGIFRREFQLLVRDKNLLFQIIVFTLGMPISVVFFDPALIMNLISKPLVWGIISASMAFVVLMMTCLRLVIQEQKALWLLFTFPQSITKILLKKSIFWTILAGGISLIYFLGGVILRGRWTYLDTQIFLFLVFAIPLAAGVGVILAILGSDPLAPDPQQKIKAGVGSLYFLLLSFMIIPLFQESWWLKITGLATFAFLFWALWQKGRNFSFYFLDPTGSPQEKIEFSDGVLAFCLLYYIELSLGLIMPYLSARQSLIHWIPASKAIFYGLASLLGLAITASFLSRLKIPLLSSFKKGKIPLSKSLPLGLLGGALLVVTSWVYANYGLDFTRPDRAFPPLVWNSLYMIPFLFFTLISPLSEEIIFRGVLLSTLDDSRGFIIAILVSSALFAFIFPLYLAPLALAVGIIQGLVWKWGGLKGAIFSRLIVNGGAWGLGLWLLW